MVGFPLTLMVVVLFVQLLTKDEKQAKESSGVLRVKRFKKKVADPLLKWLSDLIKGCLSLGAFKWVLLLVWLANLNLLTVCIEALS